MTTLVAAGVLRRDQPGPAARSCARSSTVDRRSPQIDNAVYSAPSPTTHRPQPRRRRLDASMPAAIGEDGTDTLYTWRRPVRGRLEVFLDDSVDPTGGPEIDRHHPDPGLTRCTAARQHHRRSQRDRRIGLLLPVAVAAQRSCPVGVDRRSYPRDLHADSRPRSASSCG